MTDYFSTFKYRKMKASLYLFLGIILSMIYTSANAQITVSKLFNDGMVLQRGQEISVWGWGDEGTSVSVNFSDSIRTTTVTSEGSWKVMLPSFEAGGPYSMTITAGEQTIDYDDILVGDIYMISGQSNMEWPLNSADGGAAEASSANFTDIREFKIPKATAEKISDKLSNGSWRKAVSGSAGAFSAVGYYFAKKLHEEIDVPIGLINNSYGGARIEAFMSEDMLGFDETDIILANGQPERQPTLIYNKMVHPILPFAYKGVLWYQAESNGDSMDDALEYGELFKTMISSWRDSLGLGDLPFLWVQLPNFGNPVGDIPSTWDAWPQLRAQQSLALELPNTGEAITIDVGGVDIHPTNKEPVGERLSLLAREIIYGETIVAKSPRYAGNALSDSGSVVVKFNNVGSGLITQNPATDSVHAFALAGENNVFQWANAEIQDTQVVVWHPDIPNPKAIRYAWEYNPGSVNLYNVEGLPAAPFEASVNIGFGIGSFGSERSAIEEGQSTTLSWEVFYASSVTLDGEVVDTLGSKVISPTVTTEYELIAVNKGNPSETDTAVVQVVVLDPEDINRTFGKPVTASTYESCCDEDRIPAFAIDENLETRWSSAWSDGTGDNPAEPQHDNTPNDEWITVDLQDYVELNRVILQWEAAYGSSYDIQTSLDGYLWTTAFEERASNGGEDKILLDNPPAGRYLRMHGLHRATEFGYSLFEIAAYGSTSDIQPPSVSLSTTAGNLLSPDIESIEITAITSDTDGSVASVQFLVNGVEQTTLTEEPYILTLELGDASDYTISAIATDDSDLSIQSAPLTLYVDDGSLTKLEAENASTTGGATVEEDASTSGGSYLDLQDDWTVTFPEFDLDEVGEKLINVRYQLTYDAPKSQYLVINGDTVEVMEFTAPDNSVWLNYTTEYNFESAENNQIAMHGFWNWMSIDYIQVAGVALGLPTEEEGSGLPKKVDLLQNYPNPFNPTTQISFQLPANDQIRLQVFDITGRLVSTLVEGQKSAGYHTVIFDASRYSSGIYIYQITGSFGVLTKKMSLIK
jgi:hypothetical protein